MEWDVTVKIPTDKLKIVLDFIKKAKQFEFVKIYAKKDYPRNKLKEG